jgi:hypothetical protein
MRSRDYYNFDVHIREEQLAWTLPGHRSSAIIRICTSSFSQVIFPIARLQTPTPFPNV